MASYRSDASWREAFNHNRRMWARLSAFVIWSLVAATAVFWALRFSARPLQTPAYAVAVGKSAPIRGDLTRLFGAAPIVAVLPDTAPEAPSRFKLIGVMAPKSSEAQAMAGRGLALIAIDGKPARAYAVGSRLDSDLVLQSVSMRSASLGPAQGNRSVLLELPVLPAPSTGVLPAPGGPAVAAAPMRAAPLALPSPAPAGAIATLPPQPAPMMQPQPVPQAAPSMQPPTIPSQVAPDNFRSQ